MRNTLRVAFWLAAAALTLPAQAADKQDTPRPKIFQGVLVDAGCRDFSAYNLNRPPASVAVTSPAPAAKADSGTPLAAAPNGGTESNATRTAFGVTVDAQALAAQRGDVMPHQVADLVSRQSDPACAIKGNTRAYALLLDDGRLLDLDDGGNTYATVAVEGSRQGRAMLTGLAPGFKPRATVKGKVQGDKIVAAGVQLP